MDLLKKYETIVQKMSGIDYGKLWPNFFQHKIALYNDHEVCFRGKMFHKTSEFIANTSIEYEKERIGIWDLQTDIDDDVLTSKLIHETFHAFQVENMESRYPNELEALLKYNYDPTHLSLKMKENRLLEDIFRQLIQIRKYRLQKFPYEASYELLVEQIEGTANFVELESLRQLDAFKYERKLKQMKESIQNPNHLQPIRIMSYDVGALMIKVLVDNNLSFNYVFNHQSYLDAYLNPNDQVDPVIEESLEIQTFIDSFKKETETLVANSVKKENLVAQGEFELLGVNIYNARYWNHYIVTEYFLMYKEDSNDKVLYGDFVVKVNDKLTILEVYKLIR